MDPRAHDGAGPVTGAASGKIAIRGLRKVFADRGGRGGTVGLDGIDLDVQEGEFFCLLGPSGCGKTTLLNILAGFDQPTGGEALLDGRRISAPGPDRGVVFQEYALFPWLSVMDNVMFGLIETGTPRPKARETAEQYIALTGLRGFEKSLPHQLSGGMRQRVSLARVLANSPEILLLDEPFAALDAQTRLLMQRELIKIIQSVGKTCFFITHSIDEAIFLGTRVAIMTARPGRIKKILEVTLPYLRDVTSSEFNALKREALKLIEEEVEAAGRQ
ncbi:MAG: ABC transporter ATP-binding protein [Deltaproteobacteria bacterium]|nr:ABC transporter ATP-binding protein [Deltaproteobacteria bacterium]